MKVICSSDESLYRPEVVRWRDRMAMMAPLGDVVVALPCSMKKPYSNSKSHQKFKRATKGYQEVIGISGSNRNFPFWNLSKGNGKHISYPVI